MDLIHVFKALWINFFCFFIFYLFSGLNMSFDKLNMLQSIADPSAKVTEGFPSFFLLLLLRTSTHYSVFSLTLAYTGLLSAAGQLNRTEQQGGVEAKCTCMRGEVFLHRHVSFLVNGINILNPYQLHGLPGCKRCIVNAPVLLQICKVNMSPCKEVYCLR